MQKRCIYPLDLLGVFDNLKGMRVKNYTIEAPGRDAEQVKGTAKAAQRRVRELHRAGVKATLTRTTRAQARALAA